MGINDVDYEFDFFPVDDGKMNGDAIAMRWGYLQRLPIQQRVVVIDGGIKESGDTIVEHVRQYYSTSAVDYVFLTHPDINHVQGLLSVIKNLDVKNLALHRPWHPSHGMANYFNNGRMIGPKINDELNDALECAYELEQAAIAKGVQIHEPFAGYTGLFNAFRCVGPTKDYYESLLPLLPHSSRSYLITNSETRKSSGGRLLSKLFSAASETVNFVAESFGKETLNDDGETSPENNSSMILLFTINDTDIMFTGGAGAPALKQALRVLEMESFDFSGLKFIQVPNHGSEDNIGPSILNRLVGPILDSDIRLKLGFVSAAKNGAPFFPSKKVTNAFRRRGAPVMLTGGKNIYYHSPTLPKRVGWEDAEPLPLFAEE